MIKVCIVEDERSLAEMIQLNLELEGFKVTTFNKGSDAFKHAKEMATFNLVILDVMLPEVSGLDICAEIRKFSTVPILFLSAKGTTEDRIAGLKHGGNDYLPKPFDLEELLLRVNVLTQKSFSNIGKEQKVLTIGNKTIYFDKFEVTDITSNETITLSKKEINLLKLFNSKEGQVISRDEILDVIWGKDLYPTSRTIDNYILLFRKIFEKNPKDPVFFHSIRAVGYKFTNSSLH